MLPTQAALLLLTGALACAQSVAPATAAPASLPKPITYSNRQYGFRFLLPRTWTGYTIVSGGTWAGTRIVGEEAKNDPADLVKGPLLLIRHPAWTKAHPREDIPIMIFTRAQWAFVEDETLVTGAAPIPPSELARNATYVFALPARYNFDYATGWEEVEKIMETHPLRPTP